MNILYEKKFHEADALRLFTSVATSRKNIMRIHYHSLIEISLILRGSGKYKTKNGVYSIREGDIFFFRPNEAHCITDIDDGDMELLNLHIAPYYLYTNFPSALNANYIKILVASFPLSGNKINDTLPEEQIREIQNLFLHARRELENQKSDYNVIVNNYISTMLVLISRPYESRRISKTENRNYKKLLSAVKYIDSHYKENFSLDALAQQVAYSRCYFSSVFKKCMGMSVWDYLCIKRIEEALTLIKTTDKNILDIALECGFNNTVNFYKIFKKYTNVSPGAFRK